MNSNSQSDTSPSWFTGLSNKQSSEGDSPRVAFDMVALEDRLLYSASPVPVDFVEPAELGHDVHEELFERVDYQLDQTNLLLDAAAGIHSHTSYDSEVAIDLSVSFHDLDLDSQQPLELAFVDAGVDGYEALVHELQAQGRNIEIVVVQSDEGFERVSETLWQHDEIAAVHLFSHGSEGQLQFGTDRVDQNYLAQYSDEIVSWQEHLGAGADLLIYGCEVAASNDGVAFLDQFSSLTGMDVTASDDLTGHASLEGDWLLEHRTGEIETQSVISSSFASAWVHQLAAPAAGVDVAVGGLSLDHDLGADYLGNVTIATSSDGFVDSNGKDIYLTKYDTSGSVLFSNQRINDIRNGDQDDVAMAMNTYGEFAVVWTSTGTGQDTIRAAFYNGDGSVKVSDFEVSDATEIGRNASVAISESGQITIAWEGTGSGDSDGVFAKTFDRNGNQYGETIRLNSQTTDQQLGVSVAMNAQGDWVAAWHDFQSTDDDGVLRYSVFESNGSQVIDNATVYNSNIGYFTDTFAAISDSRQIAVGSTLIPTDSTAAAVSFSSTVANVTLYDYSGSWDSDSEGFFNTDWTSRDQYLHDVAFVDGEVMIAWDGEMSDDSDSQGAFVATTDIDGNEILAETHVDGNLGEDQFAPKVAAFHDDSYALIWAEDNGFAPTIKLSVSATYSNTQPTGSDSSVQLSENGSHVIGLSDLGYSDAETQLNTVRIDTLPSNGVLILNGQTLQAGDSVDFEDIRDGNLSFVPTTNFDGTTSVNFTVNDGFEDAASQNTLTLEVQPVDDEAPVDAGDRFYADSSGVLVHPGDLHGDQVDQQVAALENGNYVVVYQDVDTTTLYQQVYDSDGQEVSSGTIAASLSGSHSDASIAELNGGGFVVTWTYNDGVRDQIRFQVFDDAGNPVSFDGTTEPQRVNIRDGFAQTKSFVAGLSDGGFVITWNTGGWTGGDAQDVIARVFNASGGSSDAIIVNQQVSGVQRDSTVESLGGNRFVVGWVDQSVNDYDVKARVFDAGDLTTGSEFALTTDGTNQQSDLHLDRLDNGNWIATWTTNGALDGGGRGVYGSIFDEAGNRVTAQPFLINELTDGHQSNGRVVATNGGGFSVFFQSDQADSLGDASSGAILVRRFASDGTATTGDMLVPISRFGSQESPEVVRMANGDILLTYVAQDGDHLGDNNEESAGNDFGYGVYQTVLRSSIGITEGATIALPLNSVGFDSGHAYTQIEFSEIPSGFVLSDGVNSSTGSVVDVSSWDLSNLTLTAPSGQAGDFDLKLSTSSQDGTDANSRERLIRVEVTSADDPMSKADFTITTSEGSTQTLDLADLTNGHTDADLTTPVETPTSSFDFYSLPPTHKGSNVKWTDPSSGHVISLDSTHVNYVENNTESIPSLRRAMHFDGNAGGTLSGVSHFGTEGGLELWLKPDTLSGERLIVDIGASNSGIAVVQVDDAIEVRIYAKTLSGSSDAELQVLTFNGLSVSEYTQIAFTLGTSEGDNSLFDATLFANGDVVDRLSDIPHFNSNPGFNSGAIAIGESSGGVVGPDPAANFQGSLARLQTFDTTISANDVEAHYLNTINEVLPVAEDGSSTTSFTLASGATIQFNDLTEIVYDPNGQFDYLAVGETTTDTFSYRLVNGTGDFDVVSVSVNVQGTNSAPVVGTTNLTVNEDTILSGDLSSLASDVDLSDALTFSSSWTGNGTFNLNSNGSFSFTPNADFNGTETVTFEVSDGNGGTTAGSFDIEVAAVNDLPTSSNATLNINEFTSRALSVSDFAFNDVESTEFSQIRVSQAPSVGELRLSGTVVTDGQVVQRQSIIDGLLVYTDAGTNDSIEFEVNDGTDFSASTYQLTMQSIDLPEPPTSTDFDRSINEDSTYQFQVSDFSFNDPDGDAFDSVLIQSVPASGMLSLNGTAVSVGQSISATDIANGELEFRADPNQFGNAYASFDFKVSDGGLDSVDDYRVTFDVVSINDRPVSSNSTRIVVAQSVITLDVNDFPFSDVESSQFEHIVFDSVPTHGTLFLDGVAVVDGQTVSRTEILDGKLTFSDQGTDDFVSYRVFDGTDYSVSANRLDFDSINPPTAADFTRTIVEDSTYAIRPSDLGYQDTDGDSFVSMTVQTLPDQGVLLLNGTPVSVGQTVTAGQLSANELVFQPDADEFASSYASFKFSVNDGGLDSVHYVATFDVTSVNDKPTATDTTIDVVERTTLVLRVNDFGFSDVESAFPTEIRVVTGTTNGELRLDGVLVPDGTSVTVQDVRDGKLSYIDGEADDQITFEVFDGSDWSDSAYTMNFRSVDLPETPQAVDDVVVVSEGGDVSFNVLDNDLANAHGGMGVVAVTPTEHGTVTFDSNGNLVYQHDGSEMPTEDSFNYRIKNSDGRFDVGKVTIKITPVDDAPIAHNDSMIAFSDTQVQVTRRALLGNDVDVDSAVAASKVQLVSGPEHGSLTTINGRIYYIPDADYTGNDSFEYRLEGSGGLSNVATVEITVAPGIVTNPPVPPVADTSDTSDNGNEETRDSGETDSDTTSESNEQTDNSVGATSTTTTGDSSDVDRSDEIVPNALTAPVVEEARAQSSDINQTDESSNDLNFEISLTSEGYSRSYVYSGRIDALQLADIYSSRAFSESGSEISEFNSQFQTDLFFNEMNEATSNFLTENVKIGLPEVAVSAASLVTAGYLSWMIRGGVMLTTLVSQPAYQYFDIGSLIESATGHGETLESIVDQ